MKVMISGASGLIGSALKADLKQDGHEVIRLPRSYEKPIDFNGVYAVIHLAGENISNGRWSELKKMRIEKSRVRGTMQLAEQIANSSSRPNVFICASAIGYYGDRNGEDLDESSERGTGFLSELCKKWEAATQPAKDAGVRTISIRTGIVLSRQGGALKKMLPVFRLGAGGILGNGRQYMSWISLEDEVAAIRYLMDHADVHGPVNLVSPNPVTNKKFTKTLGKILKRPTFLPMPASGLRMFFGEMANALLLSSTKVYPKKLVKAGFEFKLPTLESALRKIFS